MFTLKSGRLPSADVKNIIFFVRPRLELMDIIAENVYRLVKGHCSQTPLKLCYVAWNHSYSYCSVPLGETIVWNGNHAMEQELQLLSTVL